MIPQIDNSLTDVIKQNKIPNRTYKIVSDTELKTVLGEPTILTGSSIEIKDNAYSELDIPKVYGKSVQATRSGINQFDLNKVNWNISSEFIRLSNGISVKNSWASNIMTTENMLNTLKPGTTYTMRAKCKIISKPSYVKENNNNLLLLYRSSDHELGTVYVSVNSFNKAIAELNKEYININTFTTPNDMTDVRFLTYTFYGNNDGSTTYKGVGEIDIYDIMLVEGTYTEENFPEYESYGASPSPEFPSEIRSVGDDVNLFDGEDWYETLKQFNSDYISKEFVNGFEYYKFIGMYHEKQYMKGQFKENTQYTLTCKARQYDQTTNDTTGFRFVYTDGTRTALYFNRTLTEYDYKITSDANKTIDYISLVYAYESYALIREIKLQKGTVATPYSEYGKGTVEIKQSGKNLLNVPQTYEVNHVNISVPLELPAGEYIVSAEKSESNSSTDWSSLIIFYYEDETQVGIYLGGFNPNISNLRLVKPIKRFNIYSNVDYASSRDVTTIFTNLMIREKDTDETYEPYFANNYVIPTTPLRSLPNGVKDTIEEDGIHRRVGSSVLDGSEDWNKASEVGQFYIMDFNSVIKPSSSLYCSHLKVVDSWGIDNSVFVSSSSNIGITISSITTVTDLKSWLQENPITVQYELIEEVIEPFGEFDNIQNIETLNKRIIYLDAISEVNPDIDAKYYSVENVSYEQEEVSRIMGFVDNLEAIKQSAYHILGVERYSSDIYDFNYGVELEQYIGQSLEYIEATIQDTLQEALTQDERILGVEVTEIAQPSVDCVYIKFNLICYLDEIEMEVYINV